MFVTTCMKYKSTLMNVAVSAILPWITVIICIRVFTLPIIGIKVVEKMTTKNRCLILITINQTMTHNRIVILIQIKSLTTHTRDRTVYKYKTY